MEITEKKYFRDRHCWRAWLEKNWNSKKELWVVFYKKHTGKQCVSYENAVEEALCFGWIDGTLKRIDDEKHAVRFTPRRAGSVWANSNKIRIKKLIKQGKMAEPGMKKVKALLARDKKGLKLTSKKERTEAPAWLKKEIKKNKEAWKFF
ncbi:bacteriocin-protection protein [archaeon]|nr:bacteriocin-protection protein [archaeon]